MKTKKKKVRSKKKTSKVLLTGKKPTVIKLGPLDAALVARANGEKEIFIPDQKEDDFVGSPALEIFKLALVSKKPDIQALLDQAFDDMVGKIEAEEKTNENPQTDPVGPTDSSPSS